MGTTVRLFSLLTVPLAALALGGCCVQPTPPRPDAGPTDSGPPDSGMMMPDSGTDAGPADTGPLARIPLNGAAIAVTRDDTTAIVVNKNVGRPGGATIEKYRIDREQSPPTLSFTGSFLLPDVAQAIIGADDETAFAAGNGVALKMTMIKRSTQIVTMQQGTTGNEPRGLALSPSGALLYVANWADGTVSVFYTSDMTLKSTIDLNPALASSGTLGEPAVNLQRPGLAHPYAVAITDDGDEDDDDETVYVTEYFSHERVAGVPADDSAFDVGRQGVVYRFSVRTEAVSPIITLAPRAVSDPGLVDSTEATTGCFPNLLNFATIHGTRLYITGTCTSPRGPMGPVLDPGTGAQTNTQNFKTLVHGALFVVDTETNLEVSQQGLLLTRELLRHYLDRGVADDERRRMPLLPNGVAFLPDTNTAYLSAYGSDALFRLSFDDEGALEAVGTPEKSFVDLAQDLPARVSPGRLPLGVVISTAGDMAFVPNENTRNVSFVELPSETVVGTGELRNASPTGTENNINEGRRFFVTGLGRWSWRGQSWSSCESCHPAGLSDGVTWFTSRGPRQTISLEASYHPVMPNILRLFGWTANMDEVHDFEMFTRDVSGGVGAIVHATSVIEAPILADRVHFTSASPTPAGQVATVTPQDGLNGTTAGMMPGGSVTPRSMIDDWNKITAYVQQIRSPRAPSNFIMADAMAGRALFLEHKCDACHSTELWTISRRFYTPSESNNNPVTGLLVTQDYRTPLDFPTVLNPPLLGTGAAKLRIFDPTNDAIACALRAVGTYPTMLDANRTGVSVEGVRVREVREDMATPAQGADGYNIPSLLGLHASAPYLHAGNARTLEEVFGEEFAAHHATLSPSFPGIGDRATLIQQLVAFLVSIDERTMGMPTPPPDTLGFQAQLCPQGL